MDDGDFRSIELYSVSRFGLNGLVITSNQWKAL